VRPDAIVVASKLFTMMMISHSLKPVHAPRRITMNGNRYYGVRVEGAKYGVGFGSALAIAISYTNNHSILWAIIHGILGWLYVIYFALFA
jgi:hypothetical protein